MYVPDPHLLDDTLYDPGREHAACGVGFVADINGQRSNRILRHALNTLVNLRHRGACGCEPNTGDGAGVLFQTPHAFLRTVCADAGIDLPPVGSYAVGMVFLPLDLNQRHACESLVEEIVIEEGQRVLGWRTVPTNDNSLGNTARLSEPAVRQLFIGRGDDRSTSFGTDEMAFERKLYVIRQRAEHAVRQSRLPGANTSISPACPTRRSSTRGC